MSHLGLSDVRGRYGVHPRLITELVRSGFVRPQRGKRREYRFSFQDVVLLRMAQDLRQAGMTLRKTTRFLKRMKERIPVMPAAGMRLSTAGREIVLRENGQLSNIDGQLVLEFGSTTVDTGCLVPALHHEHENAVCSTALTADDWYYAALETEKAEPLEAVYRYRCAIEADAQYANAYVNLGCLLIEGEQYLEARTVLQEGLNHCPDNALLHFNLAIVLEESGKPPAALNHYRQAIALKPSFADAHFNAARLCEVLGDTQAAVQHLNAFRRLERQA
jgi:tetratricopeptide (TPR) repeat protein